MYMKIEHWWNNWQGESINTHQSFLAVASHKKKNQLYVLCLSLSAYTVPYNRNSSPVEVPNYLKQFLPAHDTSF